MYKLAIVAIIAFSSIVFAQPGKGGNDHNKMKKAPSSAKKKHPNAEKKHAPKSYTKSPKTHNANKTKGNSSPNALPSKGPKNGKPVNMNKMHKGNNYPNHTYSFVNKHGYYSHKNYGQWRSAQARNKHKRYRPMYEYLAIEGFHLIISRNTFLFSETDYKIKLLRTRLISKRSAGTIDLVEYNTHLLTIKRLEKRRASLEINIQL